VKSFTFDETRAHVTARCPFCQGQYTAGHTRDGDGVLLHTMPECKTFTTLPVNDFLEAARKAGAVVVSGGPGLQ
jgi:hypothetical protein